MYVTKNGQIINIQEDTFPFWAEQGWKLDLNRDGIPDIDQDPATLRRTLGLGSAAQANVGDFTKPEDFVKGATEPQPRMRLNRSTTLALTDAWQRIDFNGTSPRNLNTFPLMTAQTPKVTWDAAAKVLRFMETVDRNYDIQLSTRTTSTSVLALAALVVVKAQLRFVVPAPSPTYFPLPDASEPYVDLHPVNLTGPAQSSFGIPVYANTLIRQYGLGIELRLSSALATVTLTAADLIVYGR